MTKIDSRVCIFYKYQNKEITTGKNVDGNSVK